MKTRKLTAILLALCMLLSLSISAFAADDAIANGTIQDSKITWKLDDDLRQRGLQRLYKQRRPTMGRIPQPDHTGLV